MEFTTQPLSMITDLKPAFCASIPQARPVGPAPITNTSILDSGRASISARGRTSGICLLAGDRILTGTRRWRENEDFSMCRRSLDLATFSSCYNFLLIHGIVAGLSSEDHPV